MSEPSGRTVEAVSGAVSETAKFGGKVVDAATGFGGWLKDTFGTIPQDILGVAGGDWLHHQRRRNLLALEAKTDEIRRQIDAGPISEPSVSVVLPLLQGAADENRSDLQELWAALLVSALQADGASRVRRAFFETVRKMEPNDALLFREVMRLTNNGGTGLSMETEQTLLKELAGDWSEGLVAMEALIGLRLISEHATRKLVTGYGRAFWRACTPQTGVQR